MSDFRAILTVVSRGQADEVMDVAHAAGAKGGTIVPCRGSGHHDVHELLLTPLDTEREMIIIITPVTTTKAVALAINEHLKLDEPGNGLLLILETDHVKGLLL